MNKAKKICWANTSNFDSSDIVIIGIPDESRSHSLRSGSSKAPNMIRAVSNQLDIYDKNGIESIALPSNGILKKRIYDYGNISKNQISKTIDKVVSASKIPISIGGDHSNTTQILRSISKKTGPISLIYFDAHPDFVSSKQNYYGSIIHDSLQYIDIKSSIQIGIRSPEQEELDNIKNHGLRVITPLDVVEIGIKKITKIVLDTIKENVYISFDMDCLDPAYAPGVSVPVPIGLESQDVTYLLKKIVQGRIRGFDVMEVCPPHDLNNVTSHLASRLIGEIISSCKV